MKFSKSGVGCIEDAVTDVSIDIDNSIGTIFAPKLFDLLRICLDGLSIDRLAFSFFLDVEAEILEQNDGALRRIRTELLDFVADAISQEDHRTAKRYYANSDITESLNISVQPSDGSRHVALKHNREG